MAILLLLIGIILIAAGLFSFISFVTTSQDIPTVKEKLRHAQMFFLGMGVCIATTVMHICRIV